MPKRTDAARAAWLNERLALSFIRTSRTWIDDDLLSALLVAGVLSSNVEPAGATTSDVTESGALSDDLRRPVNAMSVAQSLGMADETARSKLAALVHKGTLQKQGDGLILSAATVSSPPLGQAMGAFGAAVAQFVAGLTNARVYGMETRALAPLNPVLGGLAVRTLHSPHPALDRACPKPEPVHRTSGSLCPAVARSCRRRQPSATGDPFTRHRWIVALARDGSRDDRQRGPRHGAAA
ncbi:hypothetical protein [Brevundimonas subvibrioides]|uniref:hypothetical protein n=1 Tax=Brevundimonas subvibrioides TaxID=74313 RepID=UPI0032D57843